MIPRYFGMDIHKNFAMVAAVDKDHEVIVQPVRVEMEDLPGWIITHLTPGDEVALEVTTNAWPVCDLLNEQVKNVVVANPYKTKLIAQARIKNDKVDALALARLLASRFICNVWVPDEPVREQRALAAHRATLQKQCTQTRNRVYSLLGRHNLRCPEKSLFSRAGHDWLETLSLPMTDELQLRQLLNQLALLEEQLDETDRLIARLAAQDSRVPRIMQLTGIGYFTAFGILATIGDVHRFATPGKLASYAGLVPSMHQSGNKSYYGHITKQGSPFLRWLMVEAARVAIRHDSHWRQVHERIARRRGSNIATVAVARRLLVAVWHLLTHDVVSHHLQLQTFVTKVQNWAFRIGRFHLPASSSKEFVYDQLSLLGLQSLTDSIVPDGKGRLRVQSRNFPQT